MFATHLGAENTSLALVSQQTARSELDEKEEYSLQDDNKSILHYDFANCDVNVLYVPWLTCYHLMIAEI